MRIRVSHGGESYLDMWRKSVERERKEIEFQKIANNLANLENDGDNEDDEYKEKLEKKSQEFTKILEVSREERDRVQRMQVVDRAAAAIAAARAILKESNSSSEKSESTGENEIPRGEEGNLRFYLVRLGSVIYLTDYLST